MNLTETQITQIL